MSWPGLTCPPVPRSKKIEFVALDGASEGGHDKQGDRRALAARRRAGATGDGSGQMGEKHSCTRSDAGARLLSLRRYGSDFAHAALIPVFSPQRGENGVVLIFQNERLGRRLGFSRAFKHANPCLLCVHRLRLAGDFR